MTLAFALLWRPSRLHDFALLLGSCQCFGTTLVCIALLGSVERFNIVLMLVKAPLDRSSCNCSMSDNLFIAPVGGVNGGIMKLK